MSDEPRSGDEADEVPPPDQPGETAPWERPRRWDSEALQPTKVDDLLARLGNPDSAPRTRRRAADDRTEAVSAADLIAALRADQPDQGSAHPAGATDDAVPPPADADVAVPGTGATATPADGDPSPAPNPANNPAPSPVSEDPTTFIPVTGHDDPTVLLTHVSDAPTATDHGDSDQAGHEVSREGADGETAVIPRIRHSDDPESIRAQLDASSGRAAGPAAAVSAGSAVSHGGKLFDHRTKRRVLVGGRAFTTLVVIFVLGFIGWNWKVLDRGQAAIDDHKVVVLQTTDTNISAPSTKSSILTTTNSAGQTVVTTKTSATPTYQAENILMIGSDTRANGNGNSGNDNGSETTPQSDTIMLVHLAADRSRVTVVSIPRDTIISGPNCKAWDSTTNTYSDQDIEHYETFHINNSYAVGGPRCTVTAVQELTGIKIDRFIGIDFNGFKDMVDALQGIQVNICQPIDDAELGWITRKSGVQTFTGQQALNLVRARNVISDNGLSDLARIRRQQGVLSSILRQLSQGNVLLNPNKLNNFIQAFAKDTFTQNIDINSLAEIASSLGDLSPGKVTFYTMPTVADPNIDGAVDPEPEVAAAVFAALNNDNPLPGQSTAPKTTPKKTTATTAKTTVTSTKSSVVSTTSVSTTSVSTTPPDLTLTVAPQNVALQIYNVTGQAGVATTAQKSLNGVGFDVTDDELVRPDNEVQTGVDVLYSDGNRAAALTVAAAVPGSVLKLSEGLGSTVRLMLGSAYDGEISAVSVGGQAPSSADPVAASNSSVSSSTTDFDSTTPTDSSTSSPSTPTTAAAPTTTLNSTQVSSVNAGAAGCV